MTDPFAEFNAGTKRAREDYYRRPISTRTNSSEHLCLTCRTKDRL